MSAFRGCLDLVNGPVVRRQTAALAVVTVVGALEAVAAVLRLQVDQEAFAEALDRVMPAPAIAILLRLERRHSTSSMSFPWARPRAV